MPLADTYPEHLQRITYDESPQETEATCPDAQARMAALASIAQDLSALPLSDRADAEGLFREVAAAVQRRGERDDCFADPEGVERSFAALADMLGERSVSPSRARDRAEALRVAAGGAAVERGQSPPWARCVSARSEADLESELGDLLLEDGQPVEMSLTEGDMGKLYACLVFSEDEE